MAKGAFLAVKRGKLGDSVGYNVTNSNTKEKQGWRIYQPVVSNPQTDAQMVQRVKLQAVNNVYRALKEVIKRGFEGKPYGDPSRRAWLKMALGRDFSEGPWMPKGTQTPVPIRQVPLTVGSLSPITVRWGASEQLLLTSLHWTDGAQSLTTVAELSAMFVANGYQYGDQVTFIMGWVPGRLGFAWDVISIYLDAQDQRALSGIGLTIGDDGGDIYFGLSSHQVDAYAIAVSRDGSGVYLRSTAYVGTDPTTVDAVWYGSQMYELAKRSYLKTAADDTNWPIQPSRASGTEYTTTAADGTPITLASVSLTGGYYVVVNDAGEEFFVENKDVQSTAYNAWLVGKQGTRLPDVWGTTAPAGATTDSKVIFNAGNDATEAQLNLYYFLLSQGFDARGLLGRLPNT